MADETGREINFAIKEGVADGLGIGESVGRHLSRLDLPYGRYSILFQAYLRNIPVTAHVTIGADIIQQSSQRVARGLLGKGRIAIIACWQESLPL